MPALHRRSLTLLDALLSSRATPLWWSGLTVMLLFALVQRGAAWIGLPTITTMVSDEHVRVFQTIAEGQLPDLLFRGLGYALFMWVCDQLPMTLNKALPLVQHVLVLASTVGVMVWMRRRWGVLASMITGGLLLANSTRAIWAQYAMPGVLITIVVPIAVILTFSYLSAPRLRTLLLAGGLWFIVFLTREEVFLLFGVVPAAVLIGSRRGARRRLRWVGMGLAIVAVAVLLRMSINASVSGSFRFCAFVTSPFTGRVLNTPELVAPPRPVRLERVYALAESDESMRIWDRPGYLHWEGMCQTCRDHMGMDFDETISYLAKCCYDCVRQRPGAYASLVGRDALRLWIEPDYSLEWEAFRQSAPAKHRADAARLTWAKHAWSVFPDSYGSSPAQRFFHSLAVVRPGQFFAMRPLMVLFVIGSICLLLGAGCGRLRFRRKACLGLVAGVLCMSLFYAGWVDVPSRYRMSVEWAFFAVAALGVVLPLRAYRQYLRNGAAQVERSEV